MQKQSTGPEATSPLVERLNDEADLCRNEGATDIALLLDEAVAEISVLRDANVRWQGAVAAERDRLMCGDFFTHDRTGVRFVCCAVTRYDCGGSMPMLRAEIKLAPK